MHARGIEPLTLTLKPPQPLPLYVSDITSITMGAEYQVANNPPLRIIVCCPVDCTAIDGHPITDSGIR